VSPVGWNSDCKLEGFANASSILATRILGSICIAAIALGCNPSTF